MTVTSKSREGPGPLGIGRRATFLIGYAVVAVLIVSALRALTHASDVVDNSPNVDDAHIVSRLATIWLCSLIAAAALVVVNHFTFMRKLSRWLLAQLAVVLAITIGVVIWAKQTPQQPARVLNVADQPYVVPRVFDPRSGEQDDQRFVDVKLCSHTLGEYFLGVYAPDCEEPDRSIHVILRPLSVVQSTGLESDLDRLGIPHLSDKIVDVPNTLDIDKFSFDSYRGFSFRNIYLQYVIMDDDSTVILHASCDSKDARCWITSKTDLGSLTFEIEGRGALELEKWNAARARYLELFEGWRCDGEDCKEKLAAFVQP